MTTNTFQRQRITIFAYLLLGWYAFYQSSLNPIMPFLRRDLDLSFTLGGIHASMFAIGMMIAGFVGERVVRHYGATRTLWGGALGMALGVILLASGQAVGVTWAGAFLMGLLGTLVMVVTQATLAVAHPNHSAVALTEANIVTSICASLVPLLVGAFAEGVLGWRGGFLVGVGVLVVLAGLFRHERPIVALASTTGNTPAVQRLPRPYWLYWGVTFLGVSIEWCVWLWGADYLIAHAGFETATAASSLTLFVLAGLSGRIVVSRLLRTMPAHRPLPIVIGFVVLGFPLFWAGASAPISLLGLALLGLGAGNLFPLGLANAVSVAPHLPERASARISLAAGTAILIAPQLLGILADQVGIRNAYWVVPVLAVLTFAMTLMARHEAKSKKP